MNIEPLRRGASHHGTPAPFSFFFWLFFFLLGRPPHKQDQVDTHTRTSTCDTHTLMCTDKHWHPNRLRTCMYTHTHIHIYCTCAHTLVFTCCLISCLFTHHVLYLVWQVKSPTSHSHTLAKRLDAIPSAYYNLFKGGVWGIESWCVGGGGTIWATLGSAEAVSLIQKHHLTSTAARLSPPVKWDGTGRDTSDTALAPQLA